MLFEIGHLVKVSRPNEPNYAGKLGIVIDALDMTDGNTMYEVLIDREITWFNDFEVMEAIKNQ